MAKQSSLLNRLVSCQLVPEALEVPFPQRLSGQRCSLGRQWRVERTPDVWAVFSKDRDWNNRRGSVNLEEAALFDTAGTIIYFTA
jgi:hypothetical protein